MSNIGTIKWFSNAKGFGFIISEDCEGDIFVHYSEINVEGYKTLKAGQAVTFDVVQGDKGLHATNIIPSDSNIEPDNISVHSGHNTSTNVETV
jgi:CspA family cold shock protein